MKVEPIRTKLIGDKDQHDSTDPFDEDRCGSPETRHRMRTDPEIRLILAMKPTRHAAGEIKTGSMSDEISPL